MTSIPGPVERLDHLLEFGHLAALVASAREAGIGREIVERVVTPVVVQAASDQRDVVDGIMHGKKLDGRDSKFVEVVERSRVGQPRIGAAKFERDRRIALAKPLHMELIDDTPLPGDAEQVVPFPVEGRVDNHSLGDSPGVILSVKRQVHFALDVSVNGGVPVDFARNGTGVGIDEELVGIEPVPGGRFVWATNAIAVALSRTSVRGGRLPRGAARPVRAERVPRGQTHQRGTGRHRSRVPNRSKN